MSMAVYVDRKDNVKMSTYFYKDRIKSLRQQTDQSITVDRDKKVRLINTHRKPTASHNCILSEFEMSRRHNRLTDNYIVYELNYLFFCLNFG